MLLWSHLKCPIAYVANGYCIGQIGDLSIISESSTGWRCSRLWAAPETHLGWSKITNGECLWSRILSPGSPTTAEL